MGRIPQPTISEAPDIGSVDTCGDMYSCPSYLRRLLPFICKRYIKFPPKMVILFLAAYNFVICEYVYKS